VEVFHREFAGATGIEHVGVWWEIAGSAQPATVATWLREATASLGLGHAFHEVLELATLTAPPTTAPVEVTPVEDDAWAHVVELATGFGEGIPRSFWEWRVEAFRRTSEVRGGGHWLAWQDGEPVATAGLYHDGGLGTVQDVITREDHRGRGIAGMLLYTALQTVPGDTRTVIVVEPDTTAAGLYRRIGFRPHSHLLVVKQRATAHD
jgi:GNAT superfamily N-acetyltransferase